MNVKHFRLFIISLLLGYNLLLTSKLVAQQNIFTDSIGVGQLVFHGFSYWRIGYKTKGHPFFETDTMQPASVYYRQAFYQHLPVLFDIHQGQVVTNDYYKQMQISLVKEKIDSMELGGFFFCRINALVDGTELQDLMERVEKGNHSLYARHYKVLQTPKRAEDTNPPSFMERVDWYVEYEGRWTKIDSEKKLVELDRDRREEVKQFIKANKLSVKRNPRDAISRVIRYVNNKN